MAEEKKFYKEDAAKDGSKEEVKEEEVKEEVKEESKELAPKGESALRISGKGGTALGFEDVDCRIFNFQELLCCRVYQNL